MITRKRLWLAGLAGFLPVMTYAVAAVVAPKQPPASAITPARYHARVVVPAMQINGQAAHFILDTGSDTTRVTKPEADRLGVPSTKLRPDATFALTAPVYFTMGARTFRAPLIVEDYVTRATDGLVSWPAIRDNILVFDPAMRTIRSVPELPPETAGWLKLKVHHSDLLELETPLPSGKIGTVLVDTGSQSGVELPAARWREWKTANPKADLVTLRYTGPLTGNGTHEEAWADHAQVGAISFDDVAVGQVPAAMEASITNFAGTIGLYGLTRMDLVVDARNDTAYLHPRPPPGPPYPTFKRLGTLDESGRGLPANGDWTLDASVQINPAALFVVSSNLKAAEKDYPAALADLAQALASDPKYANAYYARGMVKEAQNDWESAVADYTRAIELDPQHANLIYFCRGSTREIQGQFEAALADYAQAVELDPDIATSAAALHRQLLLLRLHRPAADFAQAVAGWRATWGKMIGLFIAGGLTEEKFLAEVPKGNPRNLPVRQQEAEYYIGMLRFLNGDAAGAREYWQKSVDAKIKGFNPDQLSARAELARLDAATTAK